MAIPKPDWQTIAKRYGDTRPIEQITEHYELEIGLADRLRNSDRGERETLYTALYDELFERLPHHPQHTRKRDQEAYVARQISVLRRLLPPTARFVEIGAGDCRLSIELAARCRSTTAIDVSDHVVAPGPKPENFRFVQTNGIDLPLPSGSADFVYSHQLMEHLHIDDAVEQLSEIFRVLAPGGAYLCITPNGLTGPHDVSRYFDRVPRGFHMREYSYGELRARFSQAGFDRMRACVARGGIYVGSMPVGLAVAYERIFARLPSALARSRVLTVPLGIALLARKPCR